MARAQAPDRETIPAGSTDTAGRFLASAAATDSAMLPLGLFQDWHRERASGQRQVTRIPFADLAGWDFREGSGNLAHESGRFFSIEGLSVRADERSAAWTQPIIVQPEIGFLGILVKEFDGVLHCLMQLKTEPGNLAPYQLSPTVQATRSNYLRVHGGSPVKYLDYFTSRARSRVLVDSLQSEQGSYFFHKRNRNIVVEALDDVPPDPSFCWLTLGQIRHLLLTENLVNMDSRTVLSCVPFGGAQPVSLNGSSDGFGRSVVRSMTARDGGVHTLRELLSWLTEVRTRRDLVRRCVPLAEVGNGGWEHTPYEIRHESGRYFSIVAVRVRAGDREVRSWSQPLLAPRGEGTIAFFARQIGGVLHVLVHAQPEAGSLNGAELAPTVQCQPGNYWHLPPQDRPRYLDHVLSVDPAQVRYDVRLSEEGGRFDRAQNRYQIIEVGDEFPIDCPDDYRWMTLGQLSELLVHGNYVNVQARSLLACIQSVW